MWLIIRTMYKLRNLGVFEGFWACVHVLTKLLLLVRTKSMCVPGPLPLSCSGTWCGICCKSPVWASVRSEQEGKLWKASVCQYWHLYYPNHVLKLEMLPQLHYIFHSGPCVVRMSSAPQAVCYLWTTQDISVQDCGEISWQWGGADNYISAKYRWGSGVVLVRLSSFLDLDFA